MAELPDIRYDDRSGRKEVVNLLPSQANTLQAIGELLGDRLLKDPEVPASTKWDRICALFSRTGNRVVTPESSDNDPFQLEWSLPDGEDKSKVNQRDNELEILFSINGVPRLSWKIFKQPHVAVTKIPEKLEIYSSLAPFLGTEREYIPDLYFRAANGWIDEIQTLIKIVNKDPTQAFDLPLKHVLKSLPKEDPYAQFIIFEGLTALKAARGMKLSDDLERLLGEAARHQDGLEQRIKKFGEKEKLSDFDLAVLGETVQSLLKIKETLTPPRACEAEAALEIAYHLVSHGKRESLLTRALREFRFDFAKTLILNGAPVNSKEDPPLNAVINQTPLELVKLLLERGADPNVLSPEGTSALGRTGSLRAIKLLLDFGAKPKEKRTGDSILYQATHLIANQCSGLTADEETEVLERLHRMSPLTLDQAMQIHADMIYRDLNTKGYSVIRKFLISKLEPSELVLLLKKIEEDPALAEKELIVTRAIQAEKKTEEVKSLILEGAPVNAKIYPPLLAAVHYNDIELTTFLLEHKADPNFITPQGHSLLYVAAHSIEMLKILLDHGTINNHLRSADPLDAPLVQAVATLLEHRTINKSPTKMKAALEILERLNRITPLTVEQAKKIHGGILYYGMGKYPIGTMLIDFIQDKIGSAYKTELLTPELVIPLEDRK